jgi:hypothetical protein
MMHPENQGGIIMMDTASRTAPPLARVTTDFTTNSRACSRQGIHNNNSCCPGGQHWLGLGFEEVLLCGYAPVTIIKYETAAPPSRRRKGGSA